MRRRVGDRHRDRLRDEAADPLTTHRADPDREPTDEGALAAERRALGLSTAAAALVAAVGIVWGLSAQSQVLLLDGVYSLLGMVLTLLTLRAARLVAAGPTARYPFGREALGPLMVGVQGVALLGTLLYASVDAVLTIRADGSQADVASALVYAVLTLALSLALVRLMQGAQEHSELVAADVTQWRAAALLSAAMVVGFGGAVLLQRTDAADAARFVDPALVLVASALLVPTPLGMIRTTMRELLESTPGPEVAAPVRAAVQDVSGAFGLPEPTQRLGKLGRKLYLELDYVVPQGRWQVGDADLVRRELIDRLSQPGRLLWINVELHTDPAWDG